jgi:uncharacterized protein YecE (DUF72 family)
MYYSAYAAEQLATYAARLQGHTLAESIWCIFDNTARGAATENALDLQDPSIIHAGNPTRR